MSDSVMPATPVTVAFAEQTSNGPGSFNGATPPLLPAFLITGVLLAAIVFIVVWRHVIERRTLPREDDPTWPIDALIGVGGRRGGGGGGSGGGPKGPPPKLGELQVMSESERTAWAEIMPLSATALRAAPKARRPRYLIPSDRPVTFFSRMFGGERRAPRPPRPPQPPRAPISVLLPTQPRPVPQPPEDSDDEEPINQVEVVVLISLPHQRRRPSHLSEEPSESNDILPPTSEKKSVKGEGSEDTSHKGKKRSLETTIPYGYDPRAYYGHDDEDGMDEVAFGTVVMPYVEEG